MSDSKKAIDRYTISWTSYKRVVKAQHRTVWKIKYDYVFYHIHHWTHIILNPIYYVDPSVKISYSILVYILLIDGSGSSTQYWLLSSLSFVDPVIAYFVMNTRCLKGIAVCYISMDLILLPIVLPTEVMRPAGDESHENVESGGKSPINT